MSNQNILQMVKDRMSEIGLTAYAVGELLKGKVPQRTIYNFLKEGRSPSLETLGLILDALKLEIKPK